ncbi:MAG: hypothetical protein RLZZ241_2452 [Bacteroidota bacterium]|jgi:diaminopimelate epimerase
MEHRFYKYQATGNDFVVIDNRNGVFPVENWEFIAKLCHRRFGIGADGLILLEAVADADFKMVYFNADGKLGSMCGNGGRTAVAFAHFLGIIDRECVFLAADGPHRARYSNGQIALQMTDVSVIEQHNTFSFLNTGSPHHVQIVPDYLNVDVVASGRKIRNEIYGVLGSNVNFVRVLDHGGLEVRTYERGVEDETLSCGTGVTAAALALHYKGVISSTAVPIATKGGQLQVTFKANPNGGYTEIWLIGPAEMVFQGILP